MPIYWQMTTGLHVRASGVIQGALVTGRYHLLLPPTAKVPLTSDPCTGDTSVYITEPALFRGAQGGGAKCVTGSIARHTLNAEFGLILQPSLWAMYWFLKIKVTSADKVLSLLSAPNGSSESWHAQRTFHRTVILKKNKWNEYDIFENFLPNCTTVTSQKTKYISMRIRVS
jgi:hypothetical protein